MLYSDVVTLPTEEMYQAMLTAEVGDDVAGDDPTVKELEKKAAKITGKEDALFVPSGTMSNLIALIVHCPRGGEVIVEQNSHMYYAESGGMSQLAGLIPWTIQGEHGIMSAGMIRSALRSPNIHYPSTCLICLENTHNRGGGTVYPLETLREIRALADEKGLPVHMDGARLFNASVALNVEAKEIARYADTVTFCISKGLSAPVGALLCGPAEFIQKACRVRKMVGGGMRQAGVIAAAGIVALDTMIDRLKEDHDNARQYAEAISHFPGITLDLSTVQSNMVVFDIEKSGMTSGEFSAHMLTQGFRVDARPPFGIRITTNRHISRQDIASAIEATAAVLKSHCAK